MGCSMKEKQNRANRRSRFPKPEADPFFFVDKASLFETRIEAAEMRSCGELNSKANPNFDDNEWADCTVEELEQMLLRNLGIVYDKVICKLVDLGYDKDATMKAVLKYTHCYGEMDVKTSIFENALTYLKNCSGSGSGSGGGDESSKESEPVFTTLRQYFEYGLKGMVCMLQHFRPNLSKGEAMWCLLMSDLHVGRASTMEIPKFAISNRGPNTGASNVESVGNSGDGVVSPSLCKFHSGWGFGSEGGSDFSNRFSYSEEMTLQRDIEFPKGFDLSPTMKSLLKRNVAAFASNFRADSKFVQAEKQSCVSSEDTPPSVGAGEVSAKKPEESQSLSNQDEVNSVLRKFCKLNMDEKLENVGEDRKDEMTVVLLNQINDLEKQVKERKEWAHQKAMQAAKKLSSDLTELKMLRMEREETLCSKKGKQNLDDSTMKRLSEMENALRKASGHVDRANAAVRKFENDNAEIRAEMEASKLSASESVSTCLEIAKREKKIIKKLLAWEKQRTKLQDEIADEKQKLKELQQYLVRVEQDRRETEAKWRQDLQDKELFTAQLEEEQRSKEAAEANNKRKLEALRLKIEIDSQRHKDDLQRLEQELSRLKSSASPNDSNNHSDAPLTGNPAGTKPPGETIANLLREIDQLEASNGKETNSQRDCMICQEDEVSIVFLPCAHQVVCSSCNDSFGKNGRATCPCCRVPIEQRIRVYGASS